MSVTIYTKPACPQCTATYRTLDKKGFDYTSVDISVDEVALERLRALGYQQAPVVTVHDADGEVIDSWTGFRPDKLAEHAPAAA